MITEYPVEDHLGRVPSGIAGLGAVAWGTHLSHFYRTAEELVEVLVPFFEAGIRNGERCVWVASAPLPAAAAHRALARRVTDLDAHLARGTIEILDFDAWYTKAGRPPSDDVIRGWLEREATAVAAGFAGLRITGNSSFLSRGDLPAFCAYEGAVTHQIRFRRILALCSYPLDRLTHHEVVDVLRQHGGGLIKRAGEWQLFTSATAVLDGLLDNGESRTDTLPWTHAVQMIDGDFPAEDIAEFVAEGLVRGENAIVVAEPAHRSAILTALDRRQLAPEVLNDTKRLAMLDARETLASLMVDGMPDAGLFDQSVGRALAELSAGGTWVRAYGEMVNVLWRKQAYSAALALEALWSAALRHHPVRLICGYSADGFDSGGGRLRLTDVCAEHDVAFGHTAFAQHADRRVLAQTRARLRQLQQVTSALSGAVTVADVRRVVKAEIPLLIDAESADLLVAEDPGAESEARRAIETGNPVWARETAVAGWLPLALHGRGPAVLALRFRSDRSIGAIDRALLEDLARLTAVAIDRATLYEQAQSANQEKDRFMALLGHELRNPLAPIFTALELMALRDDGSLKRERETIERQATLLKRLVEDLLDVSRAVHGKLRLDPLPTRLELILSEAIEVTHPVLAQRRHRLAAGPVDPHVWVNADRTRLVQALSNLLTNAAKFTPPGGEVAVTVASSPERVRIAIRDTGVGIPSDQLRRIFEPFVQAERSVDCAYGGLGLGLALVRQIVELHGGTVGAASEGHGTGAEFFVDLPICAPGTETAAGPPREASDREHDTRRVIVVDDNRDAADMLVSLLRLHGFVCHAAYDADHAAELVRRVRPQTVLLDLDLSGVDGYEVARALTSDPDAPDMRFIALTGFGRVQDHARSQDAGFAGHLVKPVDVNELLRICQIRAD